MSEELKPCPFCGGSAHVLKTGCEPTYYFSIECDSCMPQMFNEMCFDTGEEAIKAWNTRYLDKD